MKYTVLFGEVEQLFLDGVFDDAREDAASRDLLENGFELPVAVGEERGDELLVLDIDFTGFGITSVFEFVLRLLDLQLYRLDLLRAVASPTPRSAAVFDLSRGIGGGVPARVGHH